jgi:hypothetical protein
LKRKIIGEIYEISNRQSLPNDTIRGFLTHWLSTKQHTVKPSSAQKYGIIIHKFLGWLGSAGDGLLSQLSAAQIAKFRYYLTGRHAPQTVLPACIAR